MRIIPFIVDASCWASVTGLLLVTGWIVAAAVVGSLGIVYIYNAIKTLRMEYNLLKSMELASADRAVRINEFAERSAKRLKEMYDRNNNEDK